MALASRQSLPEQLIHNSRDYLRNVGRSVHFLYLNPSPSFLYFRGSVLFTSNRDMDLINNADCDPSNGLMQFTKQFDRDRSLQQDRFGLSDDHGAGSSALTPRERQLAPEIAREHELADAFFAQSHLPEPMLDFYNFKEMSQELRAVEPPSMTLPEDWTADFAMFPDSTPELHELARKDQSFHDFEAAFQHPRDPAKTWEGEFARFDPQYSGPAQAHTEAAAFEQAFEQAQQSTWEGEFAKQTRESWADEFVAQQEEVTVDSKDALSKTAGMLLDIVANSTNPKFKQSKFLHFMERLRDQQVAIEGNKIVEQTAPFIGEGLRPEGEESWDEEFRTTEARALSTEDGWTHEFAQEGPLGAWANEYAVGNFANPPAQLPINWPQEFASNSLGTLAAKFKEYEAPRDEGFATEFDSRDNPEYSEMGNVFNESQQWEQDSRANVERGLSHDGNVHWDGLEKNWQLGHQATDPRSDNYKFTPNNPYLSKLAPSLENPLSHCNVTKSILALEAAVQLDPDNASAWHHLDAWIGLAVSYTNENSRNDANEALEAWMANSDKYRHIIDRVGGSGAGIPTMDSVQRHAHVISLFLEAARASPGEDLDPEVQIALGVLFNVSEDYDKAVDCFEAALVKRPQDYLLWNKLGATLANNTKTSRALDAYFAALEINPSYIRARYNIAVSCIQLGNHREAAEHLLGALGIQQSNAESLMVDDGGKGKSPVLVGNVGANMHSVVSNNVWSTLKTVVDSYMRRHDLAEACDRRDLAPFRKEFDF
ncbi:hypothetical protein SeMB42_g02961 [Synchytrium endobioticum]|uniref:Uncharacterized protein n=1 Tax=Synchytrium endobioticum TaxID=286115 RepID=A0A507DAY1_9FUNG|nr:hypothetical protein SeMB42_g02961 [Synchytrium endobioticum]